MHALLYTFFLLCAKNWKKKKKIDMRLEKTASDIPVIYKKIQTTLQAKPASLA